jgi:hypothetical protein
MQKSGCGWIAKRNPGIPVLADQQISTTESGVAPRWDVVIARRRASKNPEASPAVMP